MSVAVIVGIPYGGSRVLRLIHRELSKGELTPFSSVHNLIAQHIGLIETSLPGCKYGRTDYGMDADEYEKINGHHEPGVLPENRLSRADRERSYKSDWYGIILLLCSENIFKKIW